MLSAMPSRRQSSAIEVSPQAIEHNADCLFQPRGASGLPAGCRGQASLTTPGWSWISVSSSLLEGYDEPEILRSSSRQFCLTSAEAGHFLALSDDGHTRAACLYPYTNSLPNFYPLTCRTGIFKGLTAHSQGHIQRAVCNRRTRRISLL